MSGLTSMVDLARVWHTLLWVSLITLLVHLGMIALTMQKTVKFNVLLLATKIKHAVFVLFTLAYIYFLVTMNGYTGYE